MQLDALIDGLPKAELHMHIEGSLEPAMMLALARRNGIDLPWADVESIQAAYRFRNLQDFLDLYYQGMNVLRTPEDFYDLTAAYLARARADGVRHVELFFDPQGHTSRGVPFDHVIEGLWQALTEAERDHGLSSHLILCFLRHLSEDDAFETLKEAEPYRDRFIGVGLDSSELGHPPTKFARVFARARDMGLKLCAHAGEEGPPDYVREALDVLGIDRLDHGNRAMEAPDLINRLAADGICLTVCPLSNLRLCVTDRLEDSPVAAMLEQGLRVTVNSDDPAYFGGGINDNLRAVARVLPLSADQVITLSRNSFLGSFLPEAEQTRHLAEIDRIAANLG